MTERAIEEGRITNAVIRLLRDRLPGRVTAVYDHDVPAAAMFPYVCVYRIGGGPVSGPPLSAPDADESYLYQIDGVGDTREQAEWVAGRIASVIAGRESNGKLTYRLDLPASVAECGRLRSALAGVEVEGKPPNRTYTVPNRYELYVTPA